MNIEYQSRIALSTIGVELDVLNFIKCFYIKQSILNTDFARGSLMLFCGIRVYNFKCDHSK